MKNKFLILYFILFYLSGCASHKFNSPSLDIQSPDFSPRTHEIENVVLIANGEPGQSFTAELTVDGKKQNFQANIPGRIYLNTCVTHGTLKKTGGNGTLSFTIQPNVENPTRSLSFGNLKSKGQKLQFGYHDGQVQSIQ